MFIYGRDFVLAHGQLLETQPEMFDQWRGSWT